MTREAVPSLSAPPEEIQEAGTPVTLVLPPFVIGRVAPVAPVRLMACRLYAAPALARRLDREERRLKALATLLVRGLSADLPTLARREDRGAVLTVLRTLRAGAWGRLRRQTLPDGTAGSASQRRFRLLLRRIDHAAEVEHRLQSVFCEERDRLFWPAVEHAFTDPAFAEALAPVAPALAAAARTPFAMSRFDSRRGRHEAVTLMRYLCRVSVKTSPYSSLMHMALVESSAHLPPVVQESRLSTEWLTAFDDALSQTPAGASSSLCSAAIPDGASGSAVAAVHGSLTVLRGNLWRSLQRRHFRLTQPMLALLDQIGRCRPQGEVLEVIAASGLAVEPEALLDKLIGTGLVIRVPPGFGPEQAVEQIRGRLRALDAGNGAVEPLEPCFNQLYSAASTLPANGAGRLETMRRIGDLTNRLTSRVPLAVPVVNPVLEERWTDRVPHDGWQRIRRLLPRLARVLASRLAASVPHQLLQQRFRALSPRGSRLPLADVLADAVAQLPDRLRQAGPPVPLDGGRLGGRRMALTAMLQLADVAKGSDEPDLILNSAYERPLWQLSRFTGNDNPASAALRRLGADWLAGLSAPAEPVGFQVCDDCSSLQAGGWADLPRLGGFGYPWTDGKHGMVRLDDLVVGEDGERDQLQVYHRDGRAVDLRYLGSILPTMEWGTVYWLAALAEPLTLLRPRAATPVSAASGTPVRHQPRIAEDGCVLYRATWTLDAADLHRRVFGNAAPGASLRDPGILRRLDRFLEDWGMPSRFFVRQIPSLDWTTFNRMSNRHRKPQWIDSANPLTIEMLHLATRQCRTLSIQEAYPDPSACGPGRLTTEWHLELLLHGDAPARGGGAALAGAGQQSAE